MNPSENLLEYVSGTMSEDDTVQFEKAMSTDPGLKRLVEYFRAVHQEMVDPRIQLPRAAAVVRAVNIGVAPQASGMTRWWQSVERAVDHIVATLLFDSLETGLVGVRGGTEARRLRFGSPQCEIEMQVSPDHTNPDSLSVIGELAADEGVTTGASIVAVPCDSDEHNAVEASVDADNIFSMTLRPGRYEFWVNPDGQIIRTPAMDLA